MNELIEFLLREVPEHAKEIQSDIRLLLSSIENTIKEKTLSLIREEDYTKTDEYISMLRKLEKINDEISELEEMFGAKNAQEQDNNDDCNRELISTKKEVSKNRDDCKVDESVSHNLSEDYTNKKPVAFSLEENRYPVKSWKNMLQTVCEILNQKNSKVFDSFVMDEDMQGKSKYHFAHANKKMFDGKKVPESNVYIETHYNANNTCSVIAKMLEKYDIPIDSMQIYLKYDYSPRHNNNDNTKKRK